MMGGVDQLTGEGPRSQLEEEPNGGTPDETDERGSGKQKLKENNR